MIQGSYEKAEQAFRNSLHILAFQPEVNLDLAKCLIHLRKYPEAMENAQKSIAMGYEKADAFFTLGNAYYFLGNLPTATQAFLKAIHLDSTKADYYYNLGNSLVSQGKFEEAIGAFQKALSLNTEYPDYYNNLALSYQQRGYLESARALLIEGLKKHPNSRLLQENFEQLKALVNN